jgi:hypothetical protein
MLHDKNGGRLNPNRGGDILLAHQTLDFSDRNALKLAYKQADFQKLFPVVTTPAPLSIQLRGRDVRVRMKHTSEERNEKPETRGTKRGRHIF